MGDQRLGLLLAGWWRRRSAGWPAWRPRACLAARCRAARCTSRRALPRSAPRPTTSAAAAAAPRRRRRSRAAARASARLPRSTTFWPPSSTRQAGGRPVEPEVQGAGRRVDRHRQLDHFDRFVRRRHRQHPARPVGLAFDREGQLEGRAGLRGPCGVTTWKRADECSTPASAACIRSCSFLPTVWRRPSGPTTAAGQRHQPAVVVEVDREGLPVGGVRHRFDLHPQLPPFGDLAAGVDRHRHLVLEHLGAPAAGASPGASAAPGRPD